MAITRTGLHAMQCTPQVQCSDTIDAIGFNKISEGVEGLYNAGRLVCDGPHTWVNGNPEPRFGWRKGYTGVAADLPVTQGTHTMVGSIYHPAYMLHDDTEFVFVAEVKTT